MGGIGKMAGEEEKMGGERRSGTEVRGQKTEGKRADRWGRDRSRI